MADGSQALSIYDRMCSAIAECVRVDEAKDIRDKALALEAYYRQARNLDAEREAANVRLRAERRVGELLKDLARAEPSERAERANQSMGRSSPEVTNVSPSAYAAALSEHGISRQTAHKFQALANIPEPVFERALAAPEKPTTKGVITRANLRDPTPTPRVSDRALTLWGDLRNFERNGFFGADCRVLYAEMTDAMRADVRRLVPQVKDLLDNLEETYEPA